MIGSWDCDLINGLIHVWINNLMGYWETVGNGRRRGLVGGHWWASPGKDHFVPGSVSSSPFSRFLFPCFSGHTPCTMILCHSTGLKQRSQLTWWGGGGDDTLCQNSPFSPLSWLLSHPLLRGGRLTQGWWQSSRNGWWQWSAARWNFSMPLNPTVKMVNVGNFTLCQV